MGVSGTTIDQSPRSIEGGSGEDASFHQIGGSSAPVSVGGNAGSSTAISEVMTGFSRASQESVFQDEGEAVQSGRIWLTIQNRKKELTYTIAFSFLLLGIQSTNILFTIAGALLAIGTAIHYADSS